VNPFDVTGKLALVTGGTRGIGLGAAQALAEAGSDVILVGRDEKELARVASGFSSESAIYVEPFDLMDTQAISPWFTSLSEKIRTPDILVNAAGISRRGFAVDLTLEDWNDVLQINTTAIFELTRNFARRRIAERQDGRVINIASLMTSAARPGTSPYTASKGAVGQLTKALATEWARYGILVNAIGPGYIDTDLNKSLVEDPDFDRWVKGRCPLGRWGTPADVAWPIVFLASPASAFITGQILYVDGGWLATF